ncbi:zinc-ribbon domain-containing protein [Curtobacterium sp. 22159]|uniref:zinc-ribbon domain-containing protein n=1 Tax=Curtobacterium sp. 22159 TaxID=3453882 RepID=UPI003F837B84
MIRCEHCGSMLPDGAIFCGECGRAVTAAASRRPVAPTPVEQAPPPPLQQPDVHGRRQDPAAEAWLPEATLDPATRAWLTGADRHEEEPPAPVHVQRPDAYPPRSAPTHVHGAGSGLGDWSGQQHPSDAEQPVAAAQPVEPPLDPNAYPSVADDGEDPEATRIAERPGSAVTPDPAAPSAAEPVWAPPAEQPPAAAPAGPSWWVGRSNASEASAAQPDERPAAERTDATAAQPGVHDEQDRTESARAEIAPPQPGDTAVVEPLVDRRPRPAPLVTPGSQATTCHVCGHQLEPDDIFCAECGAVRPAVTAAFTGQIVPLPVVRPDWAADGSDDEDAEGADANDAGGAHAEDVEDAAAPGAADEGGTAESALAEEEPAPAERDPLPAWLDGGGDRQPEESTPRAPLRPRGAHAAPGAERTDDVPPSVPPMPGSATLPSSAPAPTDTATFRVPSAAPLPPLPGATGPVVPASSAEGAPTSADDDLEDDVDETRIVSKTPTQAPFVLHFSTGERFGVHGTGLVGRLPRPQPGERFDDLLTVHDPGKSVSKTHLELGRDGDDLWVSDRFSGNGTVIRHIDGSIRRCEPGRRYRVERGARVDIGEQFFLVQ